MSLIFGGGGGGSINQQSKNLLPHLNAIGKLGNIYMVSYGIHSPLITSTVLYNSGDIHDSTLVYIVNQFIKITMANFPLS